MTKKYTYNPKHRYYGSFVPNWLLERTELSNSSKIIWGILVRHYNVDTQQCNPSQIRLQRESGSSRPTVIRCIAQLEAYNLIGVVRHRGYNARNGYSFFEHAWEKPYRKKVI